MGVGGVGGMLKRSHTILFSIRSSGEAGACEHKEEDSDSRCASASLCHPKGKKT